MTPLINNYSKLCLSNSAIFLLYVITITGCSYTSKRLQCETGLGNQRATWVIQNDTIGIVDAMYCSAGTRYEKFIDYNGNLIKKGQLNEGRKIGQWHYNPSINTDISVYWMDTTINQFRISYPQSWKFSDVKGSVLYISPLEDINTEHNSYFTVLEYDVSDITQLEYSTNDPLQKYHKLYQEKMIAKGAGSFQIVACSHNKCFNIDIYKYKLGDQEIRVNNLIVIKADKIYDFTLKYADNFTFHNLLFFEIIESIEYIGNNEFLIFPLNQSFELSEKLLNPRRVSFLASQPLGQRRVSGRVTEHHLGPSAWDNPLIIMTVRTLHAWDAVDDPALDG
jgi:hypothetical protein